MENNKMPRTYLIREHMLVQVFNGRTSTPCARVHITYRLEAARSVSNRN